LAFFKIYNYEIQICEKITEFIYWLNKVDAYICTKIMVMVNAGAISVRKLPQTVNNMKIETSISLEMRDEEVEIYGKPNCWDIGRG